MNLPVYKTQDRTRDHAHIVDCALVISYNEKGQIHSYGDKPAIDFRNGIFHWYQNGELHRDNDLPAMIHSNGTKHYYKNGEQYIPDIQSNEQ